MNKLLGENISKLYPNRRNAQSVRIVRHFIYKKYFYITDFVKNESYRCISPWGQWIALDTLYNIIHPSILGTG